MTRPGRVLPIIVFAQFCCTSLWFAGNAVMADLLLKFDLAPGVLGHLTSAVQFGFILGTLIFAILGIADKFSPSKIFFTCALFGAVLNLGLVAEANIFESLLLLRFLTGFSLAGIYPIGMKLAADHFKEGLGLSLGYLVGALVLGTAFPHLLKVFTSEAVPWKMVLYSTSSLSMAGGAAVVLFVPNGPYRKLQDRRDFSTFWQVFKLPPFRAAAFGYFGHMWELYAFWTFVPVIISAHAAYSPSANPDISLWSFLVIGIGSIACVMGGYLSKRAGTKKTAAIFLSLSGFCCLVSPLIFLYAPQPAFLLFLLFWGAVVVADSPLFSTLVAQNAPAENRGTALTIVNCIGFAITIFSIQLLNFLLSEVSTFFLFLILSAGPAFGLYSLYRKRM